MQRTLVIALSAVLAATVAGSTAADARSRRATHTVPDTYVTAWDTIGTQAFSATAGLSPAEGHLIFAYVAVAVYDATVAVADAGRNRSDWRDRGDDEGDRWRGYLGHRADDLEPIMVDVDARRGSSAEAAVAVAAHDVLARYLPGQAAMLASALTSSLATIPESRSKTDGIAVGRQVAAELIALRAGDGFRAPGSYTAPSPPVPGVWLPTAAPPAQPIGLYVPAMRPFALRSASQFRPAGPPALGSAEWAREYNEVKTAGVAGTGSTRTPAQTATALFWGQAPVQQARASFRRFIADHGLDLTQAARFLAMESVVLADAFIACFDAKYHYKFWRPVTAIRAGETDGNGATLGDTGWTPLLPATPNHPEYPSAHSCLTTSVGLVASEFLDRERIDFTVPSVVAGVADRTFATAEDLSDEVGNARVWGGIHFRSAVEDGSVIAVRTTDYVLDRYFDDDDEHEDGRRHDRDDD